jgi:protein TonB
LAAQYVRDWEDKVERTGNLNYPAAASKSGASQTLTMDVGINADGSIYSMRIVRSSGNTALDEAAKHIVKMSAPFAELPVELLKEVNVLVVTRVWKFSDETGMTAR